jgi:uncharacterized protein YggU (UPF0235/DUF167 family)
MTSEGATLDSVAITDRGGAVRFGVHAKPRASRTKVLGAKEGALVMALAAAPAEGAANLELSRALAAIFGVAARDVAVVAGQTGKRKIVEVRGIDAAAARGRLAALGPRTGGVGAPGG